MQNRLLLIIIQVLFGLRPGMVIVPHTCLASMGKTTKYPIPYHTMGWDMGGVYPIPYKWYGMGYFWNHRIKIRIFLDFFFFLDFSRYKYF